MEMATVAYTHQPNPAVRNYVVKAFEETMDNDKMASTSKQVGYCKKTLT